MTLYERRQGFDIFPFPMLAKRVGMVMFQSIIYSRYEGGVSVDTICTVYMLCV